MDRKHFESWLGIFIGCMGWLTTLLRGLNYLRGNLVGDLTGLLCTGLEAALAGEAIGTAAGVALPSVGAEQEEEKEEEVTITYFVLAIDWPFPNLLLSCSIDSFVDECLIFNCLDIQLSTCFLCFG